MKLLKGFMVGTNDSIVPDAILLSLDRLEVIERQKTMIYQDYLKWKIEAMYEVFNKLCDNEWNTRTDEQVAQINYYVKAIRLTQGLLKEEK